LSLLRLPGWLESLGELIFTKHLTGYASGTRNDVLAHKSVNTLRREPFNPADGYLLVFFLFERLP
jgi:hypothetical protein